MTSDEEEDMPPTFTRENDNDEREYDDEEDDGLCEYERNDAASDNEDGGSRDNHFDQCTVVGPSNEPINVPPSNELINADSSEEEEEEVSAHEEESWVGINEQEFFDMHQEHCEVCDEPGDVLCCATCSLSFHIHCVRPKLLEEPPNDWICAYCVAADNTGVKKDGNEKHKAAHACREMEWMKTNVASSLSVYERLRESNIQQNNDHLKALGLHTLPKKTKKRKNEFNHPLKEGFSQNAISRCRSTPTNPSQTKSNK